MIKRGILLLCIVMSLLILPTVALGLSIDPGTAMISGTVTDVKGALPSAGVALYETDGFGGWRQLATTTTDAEGYYTFGSLVGSVYHVEFSKYQYVTSYYRGADGPEPAADIYLMPGEYRSGIDGFLSCEFGDDLYENNDYSWEPTQLELDVVGQSHTIFPVGEQDWYKFPVVEGMQYNVHTFYAVNMDTVVALYGPDASTPLGYDDDGGTWNFSNLNWVATFTGDAYLQITGYADNSVGAYDLWVSETTPMSISGTVTSGELAVPNTNVALYRWNEEEGYLEYRYSTTSDANGEYHFAALDPGSYRVGFSAEGYEAQYFDSAGNLDDATPIDLASGEAVTGINASLVEMASIRGTVTDGVSGIEGAAVDICTWVSDSDYASVTQVLTDENGDYNARGLEAGEYFVRFSGYGFRHSLYDNAADAASAQPIVLATGEAKTGVDAQLAAETDPPDVTVQIKGDKTQRVALLLSASDAYPGLETFAYRIDRGSVQFVEGDSVLLVQTEPGMHTLRYYASDRFGNSTEGSAVFWVLGVTPQVTVNCDITPAAGANGTITPGTAQPVSVGSNSPTFSITPMPGYHVADVLVDGISVGAVTSYKFTNVSANHTISASFAAGPVGGYTITPLATMHGTIAPAASQSVETGSDSATFTINPSSGYHVKDVLVDGVSAGAVTEYKFANVTANHTIGAVFAPNVVATKTTLAGPDSIGRSHTLTLKGTVSPAAAKGTVTIKKMRWNGSQWKSMGSVTRTIVAGGFSYSFKPLTAGKWRFTATYNGKAGAPIYSKSTSKTKYVKAL